MFVVEKQKLSYTEQDGIDIGVPESKSCFWEVLTSTYHRASVVLLVYNIILYRYRVFHYAHVTLVALGCTELCNVYNRFVLRHKHGDVVLSYYLILDKDFHNFFF